jgi:hypothetical protein
MHAIEITDGEHATARRLGIVQAACDLHVQTRSGSLQDITLRRAGDST